MAIQPKSTIKPLFVDGATPNGTAFGNWIDSCVFLNTDGTVSLNSLVMPYEAPPPLPAAGFAALFFNASDSNYFSKIDPAGNISRVTPNQSISVTFATAVVFRFITKRPITILSVRTSAIGVGNHDVAIYNLDANGPAAASSITVVSFATINTISASDYLLSSFTIVNAVIAADRIVNIFLNDVTSNGALTVEYKEN